eukprot:scaffold110018_cov69-Phaeocystis_antarctica.AAC.8
MTPLPALTAFRTTISAKMMTRWPSDRPGRRAGSGLWGRPAAPRREWVAVVPGGRKVVWGGACSASLELQRGPSPCGASQYIR